MSLLDRLSWPVALLLAATLGLAPFAPPHVWQKVQMLVDGELARPLDIFDLVLHGAPWLLLALKGARALGIRRRGGAR